MYVNSKTSVIMPLINSFAALNSVPLHPQPSAVSRQYFLFIGLSKRVGKVLNGWSVC